MPYNADRHHRQSLRLAGYDYTLPGAYFLTIITALRQPIFGEIATGQFLPTPAGEIARREWKRLPERFAYLTLDAFVVMPNHIHGILLFAPHSPLPPAEMSLHTDVINVLPGSLGAVVRAYKTSVALFIHKFLDMNGAPVWQRNYYEHMIRDDRDHERIRDYIEHNPDQWAGDPENLANLSDHR